MRHSRLAGRALALAACAALGACSSLGARDAPRATAPPAAELQASTAIAATLDMLQRLIQGGPAEQAETFAATRRSWEQTPRGTAQLRYALALAAPNHPARDAAQAQKLLRELLARPESLLPLERTLALIESQRVDAELRLMAEQERLMAEAEKERNRDRGTAAVAALNRRLLAEQEESARLRKALDEARAKLDAIATIERNITERKPTTEGRRP
jgi:hypothetical protein